MITSPVAQADRVITESTSTSLWFVRDAFTGLTQMLATSWVVKNRDGDAVEVAPPVLARLLVTGQLISTIAVLWAVYIVSAYTCKLVDLVVNATVLGFICQIDKFGYAFLTQLQVASEAPGFRLIARVPSRLAPILRAAMVLYFVGAVLAGVLYYQYSWSATLD